MGSRSGPGSVGKGADPGGPTGREEAGGGSLGACCGRQAQAAPLTERAWQHGKNVEDALVASGQVKPVDMMEEAVQSLDGLKANGLLPADVAEGLKEYRDGPQGRSTIWSETRRC